MMRKPTLKRGIQYLKSSSGEINGSYPPSASRTLHLAGISGMGSILLGLGKVVSGVLSQSVFVCINGFYTLGMVLARYCALAGAVRTRDARKQYACCRRAGAVLISASLLYITYSGWSFFHPRTVSYHPYIALAIATFTFTEIGVNLYGMIASRKSPTPLLYTIKTINLAASLISLVLTQSAILAFAGRESHNPAVNALLGLFSGTCAVLLGIYTLWRIGRLRQTEQYETGGQYP